MGRFTVQYYYFQREFAVNQLLGQHVSIKHVANECLNCGLDKRSAAGFHNGFFR
jgi:hypothetical protein